MVLSTEWHVREEDESGEGDATVESNEEEAKRLLSVDGGIGGKGVRFRDMLAMMTDDLMTVGCSVLFRQRDRAGRVISVVVLDASTVEPSRKDGVMSYTQRGASGQKQELDPDDVIYIRLRPNSRNLVGYSPVGSVIGAIVQYLGYDAVNLNWIAYGDGEMGYWSIPSTWDGEKRKEFVRLIRALNNTFQKRLSGATQVIPDDAKWMSKRERKEAEYVKSQDQMLRRIAAIFGLNLTMIGWSGDTYKSSSEQQASQVEDWAHKPMMMTIQDIIQDVLVNDFGLSGICFEFDLEEEDLEKIARMLKEAGPRFVAVNEGREMLGLGPADGTDVDTLYEMTQAGPIRLGNRRGYDNADIVSHDGAGAGQEETAAGAGDQPGDTAGGQSGAGGSGGAGAKSISHPLSIQAVEDLRKWRDKAMKYGRDGRLHKCRFESSNIPPDVAETISCGLAAADGEDGVEAVFDGVISDGVVDAIHRDVLGLAEMIRGERGRRTRFQEV